MTGLPPARIPPDPRGRGDEFAATIVQNLTRPLAQRYEWGALRTIVWSLLSFGVAPAVVWSLRFRDYVAAERRQMEQVAEWLRFHSIHAESGLLRNAAEELAPRPLLASLPIAVLLAVVGLFVRHFAEAGGGFELARLLHLTYWYAEHPEQVYIRDFGHAPRLFALWTFGLAAVYSWLWLQVRLHESDLRKFLGRVNRLAIAEGLAPVSLPRRRGGNRLGWVVGAVFLPVVGAYWGVLAMLAGAAQKRYVTSTGPRVREVLANRVRTMMPRNPAALLSAPPASARCPRERCKAPLGAGARFCQRCGRDLKTRPPVTST